VNDRIALKARTDERRKRRVYVKLMCTLSADPNTVIETDDGLRLRISYGDKSEVLYYAKEDDPKPIPGKVLSGADWTLLRSDGVMIFDSRITLKFSRPKNDDYDYDVVDVDDVDSCVPYLLDCTLSGMTDLAEVVKLGGEKTDEEIFDTVIRGKYSGRHWPLSLKARFEGSAGPPPREDTSWLPKSLQRAGAEFPLYRQLVRQELSAYGEVEVEEAPYFPATKITLTMWGRP
jgi:hypothetical protein